MNENPQKYPLQSKNTTSLLKLFIIGCIILALMIPVAWISSLIRERHERSKEVTKEIASKWGTEQIVGGPLISIPYYIKIINSDQSLNQTRSVRTEYLHLAPKTLEVDGTVQTSARKRGIFKVIGYQADLDIKAVFSDEIDYTVLSVNGSELDWKNAIITVNVEDSWGLRSLSGKLNGEHLTFGKSKNVVFYSTSDNISNSGTVLPRHNYQPESDQPRYFNLQAKIPETSFTKNKEINLKLSLTGTGKLNLLASAIQEKVLLRGNWTSPSFTGDLLPDTRNVSKKGFEATWQTNDLNAGIRSTWHSQDPLIRLSVLGVSFLVPVDAYQQTTRTIKYSILFLLLTFMTFFFAETITHQRIHPIQYLMVGCSLVIFYLLLLSLSEHISFGWSYLIASAGVILQITLYCYTILRTRKFALQTGGMLTALYAFLYILLQLEDSALLVGSISLFVLLGIAMYVIRNVKWYNQE